MADLESSVSSAADKFARWAYLLLNHSPFAELRRLSPELREDIIEEIIIHCVRDDCRILKKYHKTSSSFLSWFFTVARNKAIDILRKPAYRQESTETEAPDPSITAEERSELKNLVEKVWNYVSKLREKCQLLLKLAAEEYTPMEMTIAMGLPPSRNKQVADDLRYCRRQLIDLLVQNDVIIDEVL